jgi:alpha-tubulin suppressor-like RCC1 family protein
LVLSAGLYGCHSDSVKDRHNDSQSGDSAVDYSDYIHLSSDSDWVAISCGWYHSCGLKSDGSIECWGCETPGTGSDLFILYDRGQCDPPEGTFTQLGSSWGQEACAIREDGVTLCWGYGGEEESPGGLQAVDVSSAGSESCLLTSDSEVYCWGWEEEFPLPEELEGVDLIGIEVGGSSMFSCVQLFDSTIKCWGYSDNYDDMFQTDEAFLQYSLGSGVGCGVNSDNQISCFNSASSSSDLSEAPSGNFLQVSMGYQNGCGITDSGSISCWGEDNLLSSGLLHSWMLV